VSIQIPILPKGSLLYSALAFSYRSSAASNGRRFVDKFYGYRGASHVNWFGAGAAFVSSQSFNGAESPIEILRSNTLFGYYSLGLTAEASHQWSADLASGRAKGSVRYTRTHDPVATRTGLRWCRLCAAEDEMHGRPATWRLIHQLPFVRHCQVHLEPLIDRCKRCRLPLDDGHRFRLPGEGCWSCGAEGESSTRRPPTPGESRLAKLAAQAFQDQDNTYRPESWSKTVLVFANQFESSRTAAEALTGKLCSLWEVESVDQVWSQLGLTFRSGDLMQALSSRLVSSPLTLQLVAADAMQEIRPKIFSERARSAVKERHNRMAASQEYSQRAIVLRHAAARGIDPTFIQSLANGGSQYAAAKAAGLTKSAARRAIAALRVSLFAELGQEAGAELLRLALPRLMPTPAKAGLSVDERLSAFRAQVRELLANEPGIKRKAVWHRLPKVVTFLSRNDRGWLEKALPARLRIFDPNDLQGRKTLYRQRIETVLQELQHPTRTVLWKRLHHEMSWLQSNDKEWLDSLFSTRSRRGPKT
jgi:hypothetical protein